MKQRIWLVISLLVITANVAIAVPQLKIKDTNLRCDKNFVNNGYSGCTLDVDLSIEDFSYSTTYNNYTYKVECDTTFQYLTTGSYSFPMSNSEYEHLNIYGTNITRTLSITTNFYSINPVYKVGVSNLVCKVKDVY